MVSSITNLVLIGAGLAIAAGLAYFTYQYTFSDTLGGQLARSRLGLDELPSPRALYNKEADPSKPLSQQPRDPLLRTVDEILQNLSRARGPPPPGGYGANAVIMSDRDLAIEEEKLEPWALR